MNTIKHDDMELYINSLVYTLNPSSVSYNNMMESFDANEGVSAPKFLEAYEVFLEDARLYENAFDGINNFINAQHEVELTETMGAKICADKIIAKIIESKDPLEAKDISLLLNLLSEYASSGPKNIMQDLFSKEQEGATSVLKVDFLEAFENFKKYNKGIDIDSLETYAANMNYDGCESLVKQNKISLYASTKLINIYQDKIDSNLHTEANIENMSSFSGSNSLADAEF